MGQRVVIMLLAILAVGATTRSTAPSTRATTKATSRATTRRTGSAGQAAVRAAVMALMDEYEQHRREPDDHPLRKSCDYFKDHPSQDVTSDAIMAELLGPYQDARQAAYVRWQLLSGLKSVEGQQQKLLAG